LREIAQFQVPVERKDKTGAALLKEKGKLPVRLWIRTSEWRRI